MNITKIKGAVKYCAFIIGIGKALFFFSCNEKPHAFTSLPSSKTGIAFINAPIKKEFINILYYLYYYNGGGVSVGDINNDGLPDIYFTANNKAGNKLYLNKGNFQFEDITEKAGVAGISDWSSGSTMADVNGDGFLDIYVCSVSQKNQLQGHNQLFINNGNNTFTDKSKDYNLDFSGYSSQAVFFDYDHDGDLDCYILNQSHYPLDNLVDTSNRRTYDSLSGDRLYRNDLSTTRKFTDVSKDAGIYQSSLGYGLGIAVADFNNDGWDDIYVGNDFHENDYYYLNNGNGTFTESGDKHFNHYSRFSMGNDAADFNNDGQMDLITVDMLPPDEKTLKTYGSDENPDIYKLKLTRNGYQNQYSRNCLQQNNGSGTSFSDIALINGVDATDWSWSPLFADFDNDGYQDLFVSSGIVRRPVDMDYVRFISNLKMRNTDNNTDKDDEAAIAQMPDGSSHPFLFKNNGQSFSDVSNAWGTGKMKGYFNGAAYADLDNDGNLDIIINALNAPAIILKNNLPKKNSLILKLKGNAPNTFGIGAKAWVFAGGKKQYRQLMLTRGFQSSSDTKLYFGLDSLRTADSLLIVWPDQKYQVVKNISISSSPIEVKASDASGKFDYKIFFPERKILFEDITNQISIPWQHRENDFTDFNVQYLIPHSESTRGPKIAVGDVNGDGLDDFYVCGAKGQAGSLMIQQANGSFKASDTTLFNMFAVCEDVDAKFFDANGDGYLDLWVVSGGNEMPVNEIASADRLFLNDSKGHFMYAASNIPRFYENKSCITVADIDKDGDNDVFLGFLSDPHKYGIPQSSKLYLNDGKGKYSVADVKTINSYNLGMVTSAIFADVNNDGWPDLIVAGEFMPVTIYLNNKGQFTKTQLPQSSGLWQSLYATDINGDGKTDFLAGNWGHNSKLWSGKNGPLKLYVKDFDSNGSVEQILCYTKNGKEYTFLAKDELERSLPILKKAYLNYSEVAGKTVDYMLYDLFKDYTELKAELLGSSCFINDGKGNFKRTDLPDHLQLAPVFSFEQINKSATADNSYMCGGNFFGVIPYEGRYDAQPLALFNADKNSGFSYLHQPNLSSVQGQVRDIKWLNTAKFGKILVVARNNEPLLFYAQKN
ncbi:VCBS repeat-containing protein [Terrimonas pollutisoli]|uniref:VCBS repeat-containing protein n=1 Tax=Terrimonas pollutisoli TaxID=3034147 RepID=UPI0023EAE3F3|nr:VCBS repeat-containing protein [Terrimonas sp. H1YJ31]